MQIIDLKTGDDLTRQYLLQIIAEHESRGESVLGVDILTDLVRSYTSQASSVVPQFLQASFEMLREGQATAMENMSKINPMSAMPGFDAIRAQQQAFFEAMTGGAMAQRKDAPREGKADDASELDEIKAQLAAMQDKLSELGK